VNLRSVSLSTEYYSPSCPSIDIVSLRNSYSKMRSIPIIAAIAAIFSYIATASSVFNFDPSKLIFGGVHPINTTSTAEATKLHRSASVPAGLQRRDYCGTGALFNKDDAQRLQQALQNNSPDQMTYLPSVTLARGGTTAPRACACTTNTCLRTRTSSVGRPGGRSATSLESVALLPETRNGESRLFRALGTR
jgi:hypothetical protein